MSEKISVGEAVMAGFRFWRRGVSAAPGALALAGITFGWYLSMNPMLGKNESMAFAWPITIIFTVLAYSALYRVAFSASRPDAPDFKTGPLGFQLGRVEFNLLAANLLYSLLQMAVLFVLAFVFSFVLVGLGVVKGPEPPTPPQLMAAMGAALPQLIPFIILLVGLMLWLSVRMSLYMAATAAEGRVRLLSSWGLTRGRTVALLAAMVVYAVPMMAMIFGISALLDVSEQSAAAALKPHIRAVGFITMGMVYAFYFYPLYVGLTAFIYDKSGQPDSKAT